MRRLAVFVVLVLTGAAIASAAPIAAPSGSFTPSLEERFPELKRQPLTWAHPTGEPVTKRQPDATRIVLVGTDMEVGGVPETLDGYSVVQDAGGWWTYALQGRDGTAVPSGLRVGLDAPKGIPPHAARSRSVWIDANGKDPRAQIYAAMRQHQYRMQAAAGANARQFRIPALMLETHGAFKPEHTPDFFKKLLSGTRDNEKDINPRGTMTELYLEMSWGKFEPQIDVYGPYTSFKSLASECYYGRKAPGDVSDGKPTGPPVEATVLGMAMEAVPQADPEVDFSQYDNDDDGAVDFLLIIHSGPGREATLNDCHVHSHYFGLATTVTADGVIVSSAMTIPEIGLQIGVAAHEFMHALGEPDYYDVDGTGEGTGEWDLGGGGPWLGFPPQSNSVHFNPFMKVNLGWTKPRLVDKTTTGVRFRPRELYEDLVVVPVKTESDADACSDDPPDPWCFGSTLITEGYLLEMNSRSVNGKPQDPRLPRGAIFDRYSHASGLMVWHFDSTLDGNNDEAHMRVDLEEADWRDGLQDVQVGLTRGDPRDLFYDDATGLSSATVAKTAPAGGDGKTQAPPAGSPWTVVAPTVPCAQPEVDCPNHPGAQPTPMFTVDDDPDNLVLRVKLEWDSYSADDWDLYVDRKVGDSWQQIAYSAGGTDPHCAPETLPGCAVTPNPQSESTTILKPAPGEYRVRAVNWLAPTQPAAKVIVEFQPTFGKGGMANTLDWGDKKTGWAFTNIRPNGDGVRVDLVKHTRGSLDLSADVVTTAEPLVMGRAGSLNTRVYNHGGKAAGPVTLTVTDNGTAALTKRIGKIAPYDYVEVAFPYTPSTRGTHAFVATVSRVSGESLTENNVQEGTLYVGDPAGRVLIVDDDQGYTLDEAYAGLLAAVGVPFAVTDSHASLAEMRRYKAVMWVGGSTQRKDSIDGADREALAKYLDGGGRVLLTGSRMVYGVNLMEPAFLKTYFGAKYVGSWQYGLGPAKGLGESFRLDLAPGRPLLDELEADGGTETYRLDPESPDEPEGVVGMRLESGRFKTELQDFSLGQVADAEKRFAIMRSSLSWLGIATGGRAGDRAPQIFHSAWRVRFPGTSVPVVAGVAAEDGVSDVTLLYRRHAAAAWSRTAMVESTRPGMFEAMIPAAAVTSDGFEYRIEAVDGAGARAADPALGETRDAHIVSVALGPKAAAVASILSPGAKVKGTRAQRLPATGSDDAAALGLLAIAVAAVLGRRVRRGMACDT